MKTTTRHWLSVTLAILLSSPSIAQEKSKPFDPFREIEPEHMKADVPGMIHIRSYEEARRVRKELISFLWKNDGILPTHSTVDRTDVELPKELEGVSAHGAKLTIDLKHGFKSVVYHFQQTVTSGARLAIVHQGHTVLWDAGITETVKFFLARGFGVLAVQMPLFGDNQKSAPPQFKSHNDMARLISPTLEPISFFVEPVVVALNYAIRQFGYNDVIMVGLSGGGWTTTLCAAIDPRIRISFPVAGTLPAYLRTGPYHGARDRGDWEQSYDALYRIANYLDLYVLGATGPGRSQRQVLNQFDSCCFAGVRFRTYEKHVQAAVTAVGTGAFDVFLDDTHRGHLISQQVRDKAFVPLIEKK